MDSNHTDLVTRRSHGQVYKPLLQMAMLCVASGGACPGTVFDRQRLWHVAHRANVNGLAPMRGTKWGTRTRIHAADRLLAVWAAAQWVQYDAQAGGYRLTRTAATKLAAWALHPAAKTLLQQLV